MAWLLSWRTLIGRLSLIGVTVVLGLDVPVLLLARRALLRATAAKPGLVRVAPSFLPLPFSLLSFGLSLLLILLLVGGGLVILVDDHEL